MSEEQSIFDGDLSSDQEAIISGVESEQAESGGESSDGAEGAARAHEADIFGPADETAWVDEALPASEAQVKARSAELGFDIAKPTTEPQIAGETTEQGSPGESGGDTASGATVESLRAEYLTGLRFIGPQPDPDLNPEEHADYSNRASQVLAKGQEVYQQSAASFSKSTPEFNEGYKFALDARATELKAQYPTATPEQINQQVISDELGMADQAIRAGKDPAVAIFEFARSKGFQSSEKKLLNLQKGEGASRSASSGGGGGDDVDENSVKGIMKNWNKNLGLGNGGIF